MPPKDFFDVVNNYDPIKEIAPLAIQKFHMDMEQQKFDMVKQQFQMTANEKLKEVAFNNRAAEIVKKHVEAAQPKEGAETTDFESGATSKQLFAGKPVDAANMLAELAGVPGAPVVSMLEKMQTAGKPVSVGRGGLYSPQLGGVIPGTVPGMNAQSPVGKAQADKEALLKAGATPDDPRMGQLDALIKKETTGSEGKSKTEEQLTADALKGDKEAQAILDAMEKRKLKIAKEGRAIINASEGGFKPGTLDFMVESYEVNGIVPSFGMGAAGKKDRDAFWDKAAERAKSRGDTGAVQAVRQAEFKSDQSTLTELSKREQLIKSFDVRINETSEKVLIPLIKKWDLQNPRFANWTVNKLEQIMGSGELASLKLALNSVSTEVGKVEFNALGVTQLSESASKFMKDVHDENMKVSEILKVVDTSKQLTKTGSNAIVNQRKELIDRMKKREPGAKQDTAPDFTVGGTYQGKKIKGVNKETKQLNVEGLGVVSY